MSFTIFIGGSSPNDPTTLDAITEAENFALSLVGNTGCEVSIAEFRGEGYKTDLLHPDRPPRPLDEPTAPSGPGLGGGGGQSPGNPPPGGG